MALKKTYEYRGLTVTDAYHKIVRVQTEDGLVDGVKKYKAHISIVVQVDAAAPELEMFDVDLGDLEEIDLTRAEFYTILKANHPRFVESTDC